jgi:formylglycine-generating enzyme required for sulfatase activity
MTVNEQRWNAPLYWVKRDGAWWNFTLSGLRPVDKSEPVTHVSYFETDAYANWAGARLPTEFEWECAALNCPIEGNFVEDQNFHPQSLPTPRNDPRLHQMFGDVWEWTRSSILLTWYRTVPGARGIQRKVHAINTCCAVVHALLRAPTFAPLIAISFNPKNAGSSQALDSRAIHSDFVERESPLRPRRSQ